MTEKLTISKVAKEAGVNLETIRYYENEGVLPKPPRTPSRYRIFSEDSVKRLRFIKHAQELGFSLKEIKELLSLQVRSDSSCADVRRRAEAKIFDVDEKIKRLQAIKAALVQLTSACSGRGPINTCTILQAMNDRETP